MNAYWTCQIIGWSWTVLLTAGIPTLYGGLRWPVVVRALLGAVLGLALTDQLRRLIRRRGWLRLPLRQLVPRLLVASFAIAIAMVLGVLPFLLLILGSEPRAGPLAAIFSAHVTLIFVWCAIYVAVHYFAAVRAAEAEKWRLEVAMRDTELLALRSQLNPHFLFNSLNTLRGLVIEDSARAQEAITSLAALLRYTLQVNRTRTTTLANEIDVTERYLELEALRLEDRLRYGIDLEPDALEHPVPPMLVQTMVENAIKHGIARLPKGGHVGIAAWLSPDGLHVRVTNTGTLDLSIADGPAGIGLANSLERLHLMFGDRAQLELRAVGPGEVSCDVVVPAAPPSLAREASLASGTNSGRDRA